MTTKMIKSASMKNLKNPAASFIVPLDFESFRKPFSNPFEDFSGKSNDWNKMKTARRSLHKYIFIISHAIQHFGHHLTANELILIKKACEKCLHWMWHDDTKTLENYRQWILQMLRICAPMMKRLFIAEQQNAIENKNPKNCNQ